MSKPKIAWLHKANDNYYTDKQMDEQANLKRFYIEFIEKSAYDEALARYKSIELANKEMSRNDHVVFGDLLIEVQNLKEEVKRLKNV